MTLQVSCYLDWNELTKSYPKNKCKMAIDSDYPLDLPDIFYGLGSLEPNHIQLEELNDICKLAQERKNIIILDGRKNNLKKFEFFRAIYNELIRNQHINFICALQVEKITVFIRNSDGIIIDFLEDKFDMDEAIIKSIEYLNNITKLSNNSNEVLNNITHSENEVTKYIESKYAKKYLDLFHSIKFIYANNKMFTFLEYYENFGVNKKNITSIRFKNKDKFNLGDALDLQTFVYKFINLN